MIVELDLRHDAAVRRLIADFHAADEPTIPAFFCAHDAPIETMVASLRGWEVGVGLSGGMVPTTTRFWERDGELLGAVNIRHTLTDSLLRYGGSVGYSVRPSARRKGVAGHLLAHGLSVARQHGQERARLTCDPHNIGSVKTIVGAGGVLETTEYNERLGRDVALYWVPLGGQP